jgi:hypothetical protein
MFKTLLIGLLISLPLAGDSITKSGWVYQTPLPSDIVRLDTMDDPFYDSAVTAMNDSGVVIGDTLNDGSSGGATFGTVWEVSSCKCGGSPGGLFPLFSFPPYAAPESSTYALDITDSDLVLFSFEYSEYGNPPGNYEVYDINTNSWSLPGISPADLGWTHTPRLSTRGWTVENANVLNDLDHTQVWGTQAFLVETPEPGTFVLLAFCLVALVFLKARLSRVG